MIMIMDEISGVFWCVRVYQKVIFSYNQFKFPLKLWSILFVLQIYSYNHNTSCYHEMGNMTKWIFLGGWRDPPQGCKICQIKIWDTQCICFLSSHNKVPQPGHLQTTKMYCLTVRRLEVYNHSISRARLPLQALGKDPFLILPGSSGCW